jgi:DNA-binding CsgD family transcriptional regulator
MTNVQNIAHVAIDELRSARTDFQIMEALARLVVRIDCSHFQMAPGPLCPMPSPNELLNFGNFDISLKKFYESEASSLCDPVRKVALNQSGPVGWRRIFVEAKNPSERNFVNTFRSLGIRDGLTFPIHGPSGCVAMLMVGAARQLAFKAEDAEALNLVAVTLMQRIKHIKAAALFKKPEPTRLTSREMECLSWVLEGKTNWEIGVLMGVAARTVQFHLANCARKMGVHNRIQSAVRALVEGAILPPAHRGIDYNFAGKTQDGQSRPFSAYQSPIESSDHLCFERGAKMGTFGIAEFNCHAEDSGRNMKFTMD